MFFQRINTTNDDYKKYFEAYIKVINSYERKTPIHPGLFRSKLAKMEILDTYNPTPEVNYQTEEKFKE